MEIKAKAKYIRQSPSKIRLVANLINKMGVKEAQNQLEVINRRAAGPILKLLNSAVANAKNNFNLEKNNLYIKEIKIDEGPTLKRWRPRAFGRSASIRKRSSHISVILGERVETKIKKRPTKGKTKEKIEVVKTRPKEPLISEKVGAKEKKPVKGLTKDKKGEIFDATRKGKDRSKQHLDKIRKRQKGGLLKRIFRRKSF